MDETQVGIIGSGPAGLMLGELLAAQGVESVILEHRDRAYCEARIRAGVLEQGTVELLDSLGASQRLHSEGLVHEGIYLQFNGVRHRIHMTKLTNGKTITVYGQQEVVRDLIEARLQGNREIIFGAEALNIENVGSSDSKRPEIRYRLDNREELIKCDIVAGCDGFHGLSRTLIPPGVLTTYERDYPFAWLGILAQVPPSTDELIYAFHDRGFAMHSLRSPTLSRLYLQVHPDDLIENWPDDRIWEELQTRLGSEGWSLNEGPILDKGITPMRSFVGEPMSYGKLFLAGDAAHIVPPTGAKGLNLAIADVKVLAEVISQRYHSGDMTGLASYSRRCLSRVWKAQSFSTMMTAMMHLDPREDAFGRALQRTRQDYTVSSIAASTSLSENYVGLPFDSEIMPPLRHR